MLRSRSRRGDCFWRVSALDELGLPGQRSDTWRFRVTPDDTAPFLRIDRPTRDAIFREASIDVSGESEPGADVTVNAGTIEVERGRGLPGDHRRPTPGDNTLVITGHRRGRQRHHRRAPFRLHAGPGSVVAYDPAIPRLAPTHFLAEWRHPVLAGTTTADSAIEIRSGDVRAAAALGDASGVFRVNVPLA